jgi:hypothetical protein
MSFSQVFSVRDVKQSVIDQKPRELIDFLQTSSPSSPPPSRVEEIRILHLGKFLDDSKILKGTPRYPLLITVFSIPELIQSFLCDRFSDNFLFVYCPGASFHYISQTVAFRMGPVK